ncbi:MAG TPA: hypothetical protein DDY98_01520 [Ruminococcaceae bacterium]|nr:hypothetical protein [Oscillospiraceae bacterium]
MVFYYGALVVLACIGMKVSFKGFEREDALSMRTTNSLRGFFILLVMLSHFRDYCSPYKSTFDVLGGRISDELGQLIVVLFLFYSGYGVCEAIQKKGSGYVRSFPKNRILKTLLHYDLALLPFLMVGFLFYSGFSARKMIGAFLAWDSLGNSNWYIFAMLVLYAITWIAFSVFGKRKYLAAAAVTVLTIVYMFVVSKFQGYWWYDTVLCYPLGMWFSLFKTKIIPFVTRNNLVWLVTVAVLAVGLRYTHWVGRAIWWRVAEACCFALLVVFGSMKLTVHNRVLEWLGKHTFEIFILQRLPMKLLCKQGLAPHQVLFFAVVLVITLALSFLFRWLMQKTDAVLFKPKKTNE